MSLFLASIFENPVVIAALVSAPLLYFATLSLGRWLKRQHQVPLGTSYHFFCLALACYLPLSLLEAYQTELPLWAQKAMRLIGSGLILLSVIFALALFRRFYWQHWFRVTHKAEAPKLLQQVFGFAMFTIALMLVLNLRHDQRVDGLLAGSGIAAIVIGFAMQETLANIVSGIALQISKPFQVGDWLQFDKIRAEVMEMNWRSTKLRTNDDVYLDMPNKTVASGLIVNLNYPTRSHAHRIRIKFDYHAPPSKVHDVLRHAAQSATHVLAHPPVKVFLVEFSDFAVFYEIKYYIDDEARFNDVESQIKTNVWYETRRHGLLMPYPIRTVQLERPQRAGKGGSLQRAREILEKQELFASLDDAQRGQLLEESAQLRFGRGEAIIQQGQEGGSMFIIVEGDAIVSVKQGEKTLAVATLKAGDAFGEMSLLTGEQRSASVVAQSDCEVCEIHRRLLQPLLQANKDLAARLSDMLAQRKLATEGLLAVQAEQATAHPKHKEYANGILQKIRSLFNL